MTALDPDRGGEIVWQKRVGHGGKLGGVKWGAATDGAIFTWRCPTSRSARPAGRRARSPRPSSRVCVLPRPKTGGGLDALKLDTGEEVWRTPHPGCHDVPGCSPAQSAAVTAIPGMVFSAAGSMGAFAPIRARMADSSRTSIRKANTHGQRRRRPRRLDRRAGPVVVGGMLYVIRDRLFSARARERSPRLFGGWPLKPVSR